MFVSDKIEVREQNGEKALFLKEDVNKDELLLEFEKNFISKPTRTTLQIDEHKYQESKDPNATENFLNHSCNPNCYIDFDNLTLVPLESISKGEQLSYHYLTAECKGEDSFMCRCGSLNCLGIIRSFVDLDYEQQLSLVPYLSPFLKKKLTQ